MGFLNGLFNGIVGMNSEKEAFEEKISSRYMDETPPQYKEVFDEDGIPTCVPTSQAEQDSYRERAEQYNKNLISSVSQSAQDRIDLELWDRNNQMLLSGGCTPEFEEKLRDDEDNQYPSQQPWDTKSVWSGKPRTRRKLSGWFF